MIDLEPKYLEFVKKTVSSHLKDYRLYMFGSRVKGTAKPYSDIDLAIDSKELTSNIKSALEFDFENSLLPYKVDIIDLNNISSEFKAVIENNLVRVV